MAHNSRRDRGSTPTVGSSKSSRSLGRTREQARPSILLHAPGQGPGQAAREGGQAGELHELGVALGPLGRGQVLQVRVEIQVLLHG